MTFDVSIEEWSKQTAAIAIGCTTSWLTQCPPDQVLVDGFVDLDEPAVGIGLDEQAEFMGTNQGVDVPLDFFRGTLCDFAQSEGSTLTVCEEP